MALRLVLFLLVGESFIRGTDAVKSKYVCQGQKLRLRCTRHYVLRIYSANYGRLEPGTSICPHQNISSLSCSAPNVLSKMRLRCANKPKCTVRADGTVFGDPCPGTYKYFEVIYGCVVRDYWTPTPRATKTARKPKHNHNRTTLSTVKFTTWKTPKATSIDITTTTPITRLQNISTSTLNTRPQPGETRTILPTPFPSAKERSFTSLTTQATFPHHNTPETEFSGRRGEEHGFFALLTSLYLTYRFIKERPQYTLVVFLSAVAGATAFLLILLLGLHLCKRRRRKRKFSAEDAEMNEPEQSKKQRTVTIEIQNSDDETKEINVNPGDIIIIDHDDVNSPCSEDLGYLSELVRLYNSQDIASDDQISIRKQCSTCDSPSVISTEPSDSGTRDSKSDSGMKRCTCQTTSLMPRPSSLLRIM